MTSGQFRAPHCLHARGCQRRGQNNTWSVHGGWSANNNSELLSFRNDPLPHTLHRVVADKHLSTVDHLAVDNFSAHHHERQKRLAVFSKSGAHAFSERAAGEPRGMIPLHPPDNLAYETESRVQASVLEGHVHPADRPKGKLDTHWIDGLARDGRGVGGGFAANQHPDVVTTQNCHQNEVARQKDEHQHKNLLITRGRAWIDQQEPPSHVKAELRDQMFMKLPSFMSRQPRARSDLMPGRTRCADQTLSIEFRAVWCRVGCRWRHKFPRAR